MRKKPSVDEKPLILCDFTLQYWNTVFTLHRWS